ncbi:MAG: MFS transporter [Bacillota bacterium]
MGFPIKFKIYYLFFYIFPAALTYLNIYLEGIGISATQIGLMNSVSRALSILILPVWGMLADYFGANKKVLMIALGGTCIFMLSFLLTRVYIVIFIIFILYTLFRSPSPSLSDALVLNYLEDRSDEYGKYRVWGSLGYMAAVTPFGFLIEQTQARILFYLAGGALFITFLIASRLPKSNKTLEVASLSDFKILLKNKQLFKFLILVFILQAPLRSYLIYFPIYFKGAGGGETLLGIAMVMASGSELLIFQKSEKFFEYLSIKNIFIFLAGIFTLRWFLVAIFPLPKILILLQLLHGITFGLFHVTTVYYISKIVGDSFEATGQNLYASTISIATVVSSLLGGIIYDQLGGSNLFLLGSIISLLAGIGCYYNIFISPQVSGEKGEI